MQVDSIDGTGVVGNLEDFTEMDFTDMERSVSVLSSNTVRLIQVGHARRRLSCTQRDRAAAAAATSCRRILPPLLTRVLPLLQLCLHFHYHTTLGPLRD